MRRGKDIIGLPIVALNTGDKIGHVEDLIYSVDERSLKAIKVKSGWLRDGEAILFSDIISLGQDAIMVSNAHVKNKIKSLPQIQAAQRGTRFDKQRLLTASGEIIGTVEDVVFDERNGTLIAVEVSDGLLTDLMSGRTRLQLPEEIVLNEVNCVIPEWKQEG